MENITQIQKEELEQTQKVMLDMNGLNKEVAIGYYKLALAIYGALNEGQKISIVSIRRAVQKLSLREKFLIEELFNLKGYGYKDIVTIAYLFRTTEQKVQQLRDTCLRKLRKRLINE